jgi:2-hydroxychromene-2-carboxylate isomerase
MRQLTFYFDPISPYAYLAFHALPQALQGHSIAVQYKPILFAALLQANGQKGPAEIPGKREWTYRQVLWSAQQLGIPMALPKAHPFNPLALLRALLAGADASGCVNRYLTGLAFDHVWREGADAADPVRIKDFSAQIAAHCEASGRALVEADDVKTQLRRNTEDALALDVFGVPTAHIEGHNFWGADGLAMLTDYLSHPEWFLSDEYQRVGELPIGVSRQSA